MKILIVDDSDDNILLLQTILKIGGHTDLVTAKSAIEAFNHLGMNKPANVSTDVDLILMDVMMPEIDGIEACRMIKGFDYLHDVPLIMVTATDEVKYLQNAFVAGAMDYILKPVKNLELLARVGSALRLKCEIDRRKAQEQKLEENNRILKHLASLDGLTGVANRRYFDEFVDLEWRRAIREENPLSLILIDIDFFKLYNDTYGHQMGDECLKRVAGELTRSLHRPADFVARYGGEEFVIVLPNVDSSGAFVVAERLRLSVEALGIEHRLSEINGCVTLSLGVATATPERGSTPTVLVTAADRALYQAKQEGRNRVKVGELNDRVSKSRAKIL